MDKKLLELTKKLIRFRSTASRPEELNRCFNFVKKYLTAGKVSAKIFYFKGKPVLYAGRSKKPGVLLCGHLDVVEGNDRQFTPVVSGGKLWGRGSLDMKSGAAVLIEYTKNNYLNNKDFALMLTGDEETGGFDGVGAMLKKGYGARHAVVIPDGAKDHGKLVTKEKGIIWLRITASGKAAHGSTPWEGNSAIKSLVEFLFEVEKVFEIVSKKSPDKWVASFNVGKLNGGKATNQVAGSASAECDIRYTEHDRPDRIIAKIKKAAPKNISIEVVFNEPAVNTDTRHAYFKKYCASVKKVTGKNAELIVEHGSSDARFFSGSKIPIIISEPKGDGLHGPDEWVSIRSITEYYRILEDFLKK